MGLDVTLPSGNTISFRDEMWRADIRRIRRGTKFVTAADGSRVMDAAFVDDLAGRIVTEMMVTWSWGPPTPKDAQSEDLAQRMLDERLNGADWRMLLLAIRPWIDEILTTLSDAGRTFTHNGTGIKVTVASDEDAAKLAVSGDFTALDTSAGPKSMPTATTSAALPPGQAQTAGPTP
jgi:hypothetical protein